MSTSKVQCQCCGKMMVPRVIFGRGVLIGYGLRIGGGAPESSCCPFCLSEEWDGVKRPGVAFKVGAILSSVFGFFYFLYAAIGLTKMIERAFNVELLLVYVAVLFTAVALGFYMEHWLRVTVHRKLALGIVIASLAIPAVIVCVR